jgi:hypothetical protein
MFTHEEIAPIAFRNWEANAAAGEPPWINTPERNWYDAEAFLRDAQNSLPPHE